MHQRKMLQFEFKTVTLGTVMDPYKRPVSLFQAGVLPHPTKTANFIMNQIRSRIQSEGAGLEARSKIPGYKKKLLVQQVADMYKQINEAQANYQLEKVKDVSSFSRDDVLSCTQRQMLHVLLYSQPAVVL